jgi:hypothetical protein
MLNSNHLKKAEHSVHEYLEIEDEEEVELCVSSMIDDIHDVLNHIDRKVVDGALSKVTSEIRAKKIAVLDVVHNVLEKYEGKLIGKEQSTNDE